MGRLRFLKRPANAVIEDLRSAGLWMQETIGSVRGNLIEAYWWDAASNFGDLITPSLLRSFGFVPMHRPPEVAHLVSTGSLLQMLPEDFSGHILGSGLIEERRDIRLPQANIVALRGAMSRDCIGARRDVLLGDPGLLASRLLRHRPKPKYALGVIPHFVDKNAASIDRLRTRHPDNVLIIDVQRRPASVLRDICRCTAIVSSSLHGLICADALGIPAAWTILSDNVTGHGFKFRDYATSVSFEREPMELLGDESVSDLLKCTKSPSAEVVDTVKAGLENAFEQLVKLSR